MYIYIYILYVFFFFFFFFRWFASLDILENHKDQPSNAPALLP